MTESSDVTPYPAGRPPPQPPRPPAPGHLVGQAESVMVRSESDPKVQGLLVTVLGFRIRLPGHPAPLEVELRGLSLTGVVREGDWVEVPNQPAANGMFAVSSVTNLTTGLPVSVRSPRRVDGAAAVVMMLALMLVMISFLGVVLMSMLRG